MTVAQSDPRASPHNILAVFLNLNGSTKINQYWLYLIIGSYLKSQDIHRKSGFTATQDLPASAYWEELFHASPNSKVILTIRDNDDIWFKSWMKFNDAMDSKNSLGALVRE